MFISEKTTRLYVIGAKDGKKLLLGEGAKIRNDVPCEFMELEGIHMGFVEFQACDNAYKLPYTSTFEALTALWDVFTQPTVQPPVGRSLVTSILSVFIF